MVLPSLSMRALGARLLGVGYARDKMVSVQHDDYVPVRPKTTTGYSPLRGPSTAAAVDGARPVTPGALLVEIVFSYSGIGNVLYRSIKAYDSFAIRAVRLWRNRLPSNTVRDAYPGLDLSQDRSAVQLSASR